MWKLLHYEHQLNVNDPEQVDEADPDAATWQAALAGRLDPQGAAGIFGRGRKRPRCKTGRCAPCASRPRTT